MLLFRSDAVAVLKRGGGWIDHLVERTMILLSLYIVAESIQHPLRAGQR